MRFAYERLREARLTLDLTQEEVAASVGIDVRTYRRYEGGAVNAGGFDIRHHTRQRIVDRLCAELGLEPAELLIEEPPPSEAGPHVLPPARFFVGRAALLARLRAWAAAPDIPRVIALVAVGGAGKTSLAQRIGGDRFVWSLYQDDHVEALLEALLQRLGAAAGPAGARLERVERALARSGPLVLVLDGLEVLQADGTRDRARGEIVDASLRRLLYAIAAGPGGARALITSRLPPRDLEPWSGGGYEPVALPSLSEAEGSELLAAWGLRDARALAAHVGGHALSLAVVGSYVSGCLGGDASRLPELDPAEARRHDPLARRLSSVLDAHAAALDPAERAVWSALSIFPAGATPTELAALPLDIPPDGVRRAADRLVRAGLAQGDGARLWLHPFLARFARTLLDDAERLHDAERERLAGALTHLPRRSTHDPALLDRLERLVHHTLGAGRPAEAHHLYQHALGGFLHLGLTLGDMARGARLVRALGRADLQPRARTAVLYDHALYALALGDPNAAVATLARICGHARHEGDRAVLATALRTTAYALRLTGALDGALDAIEASIETAAMLGDRLHIARGVALHGAILHDLGQVAAAAARFTAVRAMGDDPVARRGLWEAEHLVEAGELELAHARTERNLAICESRGWPGHVAHCHVVLGTIAAHRGGGDEARAHLAAVDGWTDRTGEVELVLRGHLLAGGIGDAGRAAEGAALAARLGYAPLGDRLQRVRTR